MLSGLDISVDIPKSKNVPEGSHQFHLLYGNIRKTANEAAWIDTAKGPIRIGPADKYEVEPHSILIKNHCIAINPIDAKIQKYALFPLNYPTIIGSSFAGAVEAIGSSVNDFQPGDHVVIKRLFTKNQPSYGAFQKYVLAAEFTATKLSDNTTFESAAATVLNLATAVAALNVYMGLERAPVSGPAKPNGKHVLIYGGSSSIGGLATRYASDAGYEVITTSSPTNESFVSTLGAKAIINHLQDPDVVVAALKSHGPYEAVLDCIGTPPVDMIMAKVLEETGGTYYSMTRPMSDFKMPENVKREFASFSLVLENENRELGEWFYKEYLPKALDNGRIVPTRVERVKGGLGAVQEALDRSLAISGKKVVLDPWE